MTAVINAEDQHLIAEPIISNHTQVEEEHQVEEEDEHEADEYNSECNSDQNETDPEQHYLQCSSDQNETNAEEDYLEENTISCDQFCADHGDSELHQIEQSWNNFDSVIEQEMIITEKEVLAHSNEGALQGPDYAETTDTDGTSGSDESEFETEQQQDGETEKKQLSP